MLSSLYKNLGFRKYAIVLAYVAIAIGITLRLIMFFQDRDLIIDEANIVRNLYERNFIELLYPLSYAQYAPPIFLWMEKTISLFSGFGSFSLKLFPMMCGIAMLFLFYAILTRLISIYIVWIPLSLLAVSPYFIEYSATIKQYIFDSLISLLLIGLALRTEIFATPSKRFFILWSSAGIIAIFSSMPSVFTLAAVGLYYGWIIFQSKEWKRLPYLFLISGIWLLAFALYYFTMLKPQITSGYLQSYHADYFLSAFPTSYPEWKHDYMRLKELLNSACGYSSYNYFIAYGCLAVAIIVLLKKKPAILLLLLTPVGLMLVAAAANQYSLILRLTLFALPLIVLLFGLGLNELWKIPSIFPKIAIIFVGVIMIKTANKFELFREKHGFHELTEGFHYLMSKGVKGEHLFVHSASDATFIYYTQIYPEKDQYKSLANATILPDSVDYATVTYGIKDTVYFIYTGGFPEVERRKRVQQIEQNMQQVDYFEKYICFVYGYAPKAEANP